MSVLRGCAVVAALAGSSLLAGCILSPQHSLEPDYGRAVRNDIVAQIADPEPAYARKVEPAADGTRAVSANRRYLSGQVIQPQAQTTSQVAGSGGGGGGAPSGGGSSK
jgi:hypothetical protein